ncbi:hypothetical protein K501DRAFT_333651 [Backusella circina FSU 941]|nr:hypothetical protein K501DRAFT_333651 [Backusella circina FSU 941]
MTEVGHIKSSHACHWRIPQWSKLRPCVEYSSPPLYFDALKWSIKLYKGRPKSPEMLSIFVQLHETSPGSLRGIRKQVQLTLKINNTNPSSYYNDFGAGKRLHPVWFSEKQTKWGEDALGTLDSFMAFLSRDQASLSVHITILKSEIDRLDTPQLITPFSRFIDSAEFSDITFRVHEHEQDEEGRVFFGHKNILAAMSPWFNMLFTSGMKESHQKEIRVCGVQHDIFLRLLTYCYTFNVDIHSVSDGYEMIEAADRFQLDNVREIAFQYLRQEMSENNIWDIWESADLHGCDKTMKKCTVYASNHLEALLMNSSWLYAKPRVVKMVMEIEEGNLPAEHILYESILSWANQQKEKSNIIGSVGEDEGTQDDEIMSYNQDDNTYDLKSLRDDLGAILQCIRFPMIPPDYLANKIEVDDFIMSIDGMRDMLYEAYRYHAVSGSSSSFRCQPRRAHSTEEDVT